MFLFETLCFAVGKQGLHDFCYYELDYINNSLEEYVAYNVLSFRMLHL